MSTSILVVEDNPTNRKLAVRLLQHEGYRVSEAGDAESALSKIRATAPEMVLLDIQLPKMDGLDMARLIRADPSMQHLKIIALTAHAMRADLDRAIAAGFDGCITKPIDTRKFPQQIVGFLSARNQT